ncbi:MAG: hypothetical protein LBV41_01670 [Cytophagaceae bacterium]|jgi:hypothetical protein|nr:hypothetical protein [Cytophagaceae bacterium]
MKSTLTLFILFIAIGISAQNYDKMLRKADNNFNRFVYEKALAKYIKLEEAGISRYYVTRRIADCYRLMYQPAPAVEWYKRGIAYPDVEAETYHYLALMLRILEQYSESEQYMQRYYTLTKTQGLQRGLSLEDYLALIRTDSIGVEIKNLGFNTECSEIAPTLFNDQLVFSSNRLGRTVIENKDARSNRTFFRLYTIPVNDMNNNIKAAPFQPQLKSKYNDGPVCFSPDGNTMYLTHNTTADAAGKSELDIVSSRRRGKKWDKVVASLPLKIKGYSIAHPSISSDDERLYFVSDIPGGYGGMDIYYSDRRNGFLSQPVNIGPHINTSGNELFPHITSDGRLFFASNGHSGLGGLDIFMALPVEQGFSAPINLGPGINTSYDDFSIVFNENGQSGYLASNRQGGKGEDDIYSFTFLRPLLFAQIDGLVINKATQQPEPDVQIIITKPDGTLVASFQSGTDGKFGIHLRDQQYKLTFRKRLMEPVERIINPTQVANFSKINLTVEMEAR